jgi:hypothetical protein
VDAVLNQGLGDQGENLVPASLPVILISDIPDIPEVGTLGAQWDLAP